MTAGAASVPYLVAINLTSRCNLNCGHCYMDAGERTAGCSGELSLADVSGLLADIGKRAPGTIIVLTGGEPLLHDHLDDMVAAGVAAGLRMVIGTNGLLLDRARIAGLQEQGLAGVGISLDAADATSHDRFRGAPGAFEKSLAAIRYCREQDLHVQLHFTVTRDNDQQLDTMVEVGRAQSGGTGPLENLTVNHSIRCWRSSRS